MTNRIITITTLINSYYDFCDNFEKYVKSETTARDIVKHRHNLIDTIYLFINGKMPYGSDTYTILRLLNADIFGKRYSAKEIIAKLKVKP